MQKTFYVFFLSFICLTTNLSAQDYSCLDYYNLCETRPELYLNNACDVYPGGSSGYNLTGYNYEITIFESGDKLVPNCDCMDEMGFFGSEGDLFMECDGDSRIKELPCSWYKPFPNLSDGSPWGNPGLYFTNDVPWEDCDVTVANGNYNCSTNIEPEFDNAEDKHYLIVGANAAGNGTWYKQSGGQSEFYGVAPLAYLKFFGEHDGGLLNPWYCTLDIESKLISNRSLRGECYFYTDNSMKFDRDLVQADHHLACFAAGNKHDAGGSCPDIAGYEVNGYPYYNLSGNGNPKNPICVGALSTGGITSPVKYGRMANGPTRDGRIKPDILAFTANPTTSFSTPRVAGAAALLYEQWYNYNSNDILSSTMKGILLHNADYCDYDQDFWGPIETPIGPSYTCGWGVLNIKQSADFIAENKYENKLIEGSLQNNETETYKIRVTEKGEPLKISLVWLDPPGYENTGVAIGDAEPVLVNDLDITLEGCDGKIHYPWTLNPDINSGIDFIVAKRDKANDLDNVEQIYLYEHEVALGDYILNISHKNEILSFAGTEYINGTLTPILLANNGSQSYSLLVSGGHFVSNEQLVEEINCDIEPDITGSDLVIGEDDFVIWNGTNNSNATPGIEIDEDVHVYGRLRITAGTYKFSEDAGIYVYPGAYLTVASSDNTNPVELTSCNDRWKGIKVFSRYGHNLGPDKFYAFSELMANGAPDDLLTLCGVNQNDLLSSNYIPQIVEISNNGNSFSCETSDIGVGLVDIYNSAKINNATVGVQAKPGFANCEYFEFGGMIRVGDAFVGNPNNNNRSSFFNNNVDVEIDYHKYCCGFEFSYGAGYSWVKYTDFNRLNDDYSIRVNQAYSVTIEECTIEDLDSDEIVSNGIYVYDTRLVCKTNTFTNLYNGLYLHRIDAPYLNDPNAIGIIADDFAPPSQITDNTTVNVDKGMYLAGCRLNDYIFNNTFEISDKIIKYSNDDLAQSGEDIDLGLLQGVAQHNVNYGIHLVDADGAIVENNNFIGSEDSDVEIYSYGLVTTVKGGDNAQNMQMYANYNKCNNFEYLDIAYQSQHGDDMVDVRTNTFAKDGKSSYFTAWAVLDGPYKLNNNCDEGVGQVSELTWNKWEDYNTVGTTGHKHMYLEEDAAFAGIDKYWFPNPNIFPFNEPKSTNYNIGGDFILDVELCGALNIEPAQSCDYPSSPLPPSDNCDNIYAQMGFVAGEIKSLQEQLNTGYGGCQQPDFYPCIATPWNDVASGPSGPVKPDVTIGGPIVIGPGDGWVPGKPGRSFAESERNGRVRPTVGDSRLGACERESRLRELELQLVMLIAQYLDCLEATDAIDINVPGWKLDQQILLLEAFGESNRLKVNLADAYIQDGRFEQSRQLMDAHYNGLKLWAKIALCPKRAWNEIHIQKGLNKWAWTDMPEQENEVFKQLLQHDSQVGNEARAIAAAMQGKRYLVPVKRPGASASGPIKPFVNNKTEENQSRIDDYFYRLYPNPATDYLYLETDNKGAMIIQIHSIDGRLLANQSITSEAAINLVDMPNGLLYVRLVDESGVLLHDSKIVKQ